MPDITMCTGGNCTNKNLCYRFTAKPCEFRQAYWKTVPVKPDGSCDYYYPIRITK